MSKNHTEGILVSKFGFVGINMLKTFKDILIIKNGKNQKSVENPDGQYPIYGSGGSLGLLIIIYAKAILLLLAEKEASITQYL